MTQRNRIFVGILLAYVLALGWLTWRLLADIDPRYRESAEESLVETAYLLAAAVEQASPDGVLVAEGLRPVFASLYARRFEADIFGFRKTRVELRVHVVDRRGRVVYDSLGRHEGEDYSRWRDVRLALAGKYGARTTVDIDGDANTSVMYVAAPVRVNDTIIGAVSAAKPVQSFGQFVEAARRKTLIVGVTAGVAVLLLVVLLSAWLVRPFGIVGDALRVLREERRRRGRLSLPRLWRRAAGILGAAYDETRDALAGRNSVADYVQSLTHEVKSPLSAIRGAAELMREPMPEADRQRFAANIVRETARVQELVDRMLELAALEARRHLERSAPVDLRALLEDQAASAQARGAARAVRVAPALPVGAAWVEGDALLLRRAVANLLDNAIDFSPDGATVHLGLALHARSVEVQVRDAGPGIPDYAVPRVFDKFYSLARPATRKRGTGLGLPFVKEIAELHGGRVTLRNAEGGGALAVLVLPRATAPGEG